MTKLSRRDFLVGCTRLAAGSMLLPWLRQQSVHAADAQEFPKVSVAEGTNDDTAAQILQTALDGLGGIKRFVKPGQTVAVKPNATWAYPPNTASSTDPDFLTAVIQAVQDAGAARIIVMDHCSIEPGASDALRISGIGKVVKNMGVEGVFPDRYNAPKSMYTKIDLPHGRANQTIGVIKAATEADIRINLAVAKTHNVTKFTMCLKHMMGFLQQPGLLHAGLEQGIADINTPSLIQPQLHILEAIRVRIPYGNYRVCAGPETDLTNPNVVTRRNTILAGIDPVLIDAYGCVHFFDIQPQELTHLLRAYESGCGEMDVEAALADGRIRRFIVGAPVPAEPAATHTAVVESPQISSAKPTAVFIPELNPIGEPASMGNVNCLPATEQLVAASPLLNTALIPAAAAVTGLSLILLKRMRANLPKGDPGEVHQSVQTDPSSKDQHG
ncbi:MAG: DUF362 domain-containing protein [Chloroflexi bacterium]|nr:DUF362 domain-containing protein [Chloroflexota bacterium]